MAPLPYNNTGIVEVTYNAGPARHVLQIRQRTGATQAAVVNAARNFCDSISDFVPIGLSFESATYQAPGATFSLPIPWEAIPGSGGAFVPAENVERPLYVTFQGRSSGGRRVRIFVFTTQITPNEGDYRFEPGELPAFSSGLTTLNNFTADIGAIDGLPVTWYTFANFGYNAYWQRASRRLGP